MRIKVLSGGRKNIELSLSDAELNFQMRRIGIEETVPMCRLVEVSEKDNPLHRFEGQTVNMDEVNFFAKRMESLTEYERKVLSAYAEDYGVATMKDLINLTFSMKGLSLLTDFSDARQVGVRLYMDEFLGMSEEEKEQTNFIEFAEKTLKESRVEVLPYGVFVEHGFEMLEVYNGKTFPAFVASEETVAVVEVQNKTGDTEYLYLPTDICSMNKVKERLQVQDYWEMEVIEIENLRLPDILVPTTEDLREVEQLTLFNEMCHAVKRFDEVKMNQLAMVVEFTGLCDFPDVAYIATHLGEFEINPLVHNDEEYGKFLVTESGLFDVDELLLPHINYASFAADKRVGTLVTSGYVEEGFVGAIRPIEEYGQYKGEFAEPLEIDYDCFEKFCLYSPLTANLMVEDVDEGNLYPSDLTQYAEAIAEAIAREECVGEETRGLMHYFDESREVAAKVMSAHPKVAEINGELYGVLECKISEPLTEEEIKVLKEYWTGQMSDGWGEGFEQRPIEVDGGELYVHLWQPDDWSIQTEQERFAPKVAEGLPELCFSTLRTTGQLICIKRGETGYYPSDWDTGDKEGNVELADELNEDLGVTPIQRQAMEIGSMAGWDVPGADPKHYEESYSGQTSCANFEQKQ